MTDLSTIKENKKRCFLDHIVRVAPDMRLKDAMEIANSWAEAESSSFFARTILATMGHQDLLGFSKKGEIPERFKQCRPAIKLSLKEIQNCHAWVVCSPNINGFEGILDEIEEYIMENSIKV